MEKTFYVLGTDCRLEIYGGDESEAMDKAVERLYDIDDKMSVFKVDSEVSGINNNAGIGFYKVSEDTFYVLETAKNYAEISNGAFDFTAEYGVKGDYRALALDKKNSSAMIANPDLRVDLGAIAKGYAADEVVKILLACGIKNAIIDLGGNVYALGKRLDGTDWAIGIQDPSGEQGECLTVVNVSNKSIVTSGGYERPGHIINARLGEVCNSDVLSVTVISDKSIDADALSTCLFVMGKELGERLISKIDGVQVIWVTKGDGLNV